MKTKSVAKIAIVALCLIAVMAATFLATVAYFTSNDKVVNTFTVGKVSISIDEGTYVEGVFNKEARSGDGNTYKLVPGTTYDKDPVLHVDPDSEDSWIFVMVENGIAGIEADADGDDTITEQILAKGWTAYEGVDGLYYTTFDGSKNDFEIFDTITISGEADATDLAEYENAEVSITGYAVQMKGFEEDLEGAWAAASASAN